jgi:hypothetical protein
MRPAYQWLSLHLSPFLVFAFCQHCESEIRRRKGARSHAVGGERELEACTREIRRGTNQRRIRTTAPPGRSPSIDQDRRKGGAARALPEEGRSHAWGRRSCREVRIYAIVPRLAVQVLCHHVYRGVGAARKRGGAVACGLGGKLQKQPFVCPDLSLGIGVWGRIWVPPSKFGCSSRDPAETVFFLPGHLYLAMKPQIGVMLELLYSPAKSKRFFLMNWWDSIQLGCLSTACYIIFQLEFCWRGTCLLIRIYYTPVNRHMRHTRASSDD